jgi:hypothetical protein
MFGIQNSFDEIIDSIQLTLLLLFCVCFLHCTFNINRLADGYWVLDIGYWKLAQKKKNRTASLTKLSSFLVPTYSRIGKVRNTAAESKIHNSHKSATVKLKEINLARCLM